MQLLVSFTPGEGALLRILGLIERRGFMLRDLSVRNGDEAGSLIVNVEARDRDRPLDVLARQIERLVNVKSVSIVTPAVGLYA